MVYLCHKYRSKRVYPNNRMLCSVFLLQEAESCNCIPGDVAICVKTCELCWFFTAWYGCPFGEAGCILQSVQLLLTVLREMEMGKRILKKQHRLLETSGAVFCSIGGCPRRETAIMHDHAWKTVSKQAPPLSHHVEEMPRCDQSHCVN